MKKILGLALLATAATAATASAETSISGNVALASDYSFRGISQTQESPAIQGGFDVTSGIFYAGTWGSNVDFGPEGSLELDLYAGVTPTLGPVTFNFGVVGYFYPGYDDDAFSPQYSDADFYEIRAGGTIAPVEGLSLGLNAFYSPDFFGGTSTGLYVEGSASFAITDALSISGAVGQQSIDDVWGPGVGSTPGEDYEYTTWNVGGTYSIAGFGLDLRYVTTDIDETDSIITSTFAADDNVNERVVFTIKRAL